MSVTQGLLSHVTQSDGPFATAVDKLVAVYRMEDRSRDHLSKFLHVGWLDVHNVLGRRGQRLRKRESPHEEDEESIIVMRGGERGI